MKFSNTIAFRYLFGKKNHNVVNLISYISMLGVGVGAMALIIVLSAFNGLEDLVQSLYSSFDAEIRIEPAKGKFFERDAVDYQTLLNLEEVDTLSVSLEESVMIRYGDMQAFAKMKGTDDAFLQMSNMPMHIYRGSSTLHGPENTPQMIAGYFVAQQLNVQIGGVRPVNIYTANPKASGAALQTNAFHTSQIMTGGIFSINADFDREYVVVPLEFAQKLIKRDNVLSAVELKLVQGASLEKTRDKIQDLLGDTYTVKTRYQLNELLYKTNKTEKWITFLILTFVLVIATFNIIGSLTMLILDKKKDIGILKSMGADHRLLRNIFFKEGFLISAIGGGAGLALGLTTVLLQKQFKFVKLQGLLVDSYPVKIDVLDIVFIIAVVLIIGAAAALIPPAVVLRRYAEGRIEL